MIDAFFNALKAAPDRDDLFNPWFDTDPENDKDDRGPEIRRTQLAQYLKERRGVARTLLVGEALGYQGGHFTGMAMTSERILLGHMAAKGILPEHVFTDLVPERTSRSDLKPLGFTEPTATIVWGEIAASGRNPREFIIWNAYPWRPFKPAKGMLSNRTPGPEEVMTGRAALKLLLEMTGINNVIAVGGKADALLQEMGIPAALIRHPANGGAPAFRVAFPGLISH